MTAAHTAADALLQIWPDTDHATTNLLDALRANTTTLNAVTGDALWQPDRHHLLYRAGISLLRAGLYTPAITHWHTMADQAERVLGEEHLDTITARGNLASSYWQAGRTAEAITIEERVLADRVRILGEEHPDTITARAHLASSYRLVGRIAEAITIEERVLADAVRVLGDEHPDTFEAAETLRRWQGEDGATML
jgi:tetratricopeptide (TPR) repeat protein